MAKVRSSINGRGQLKLTQHQEQVEPDSRYSSVHFLPLPLLSDLLEPKQTSNFKRYSKSKYIELKSGSKTQPYKEFKPFNDIDTYHARVLIFMHHEASYNFRDKN